MEKHNPSPTNINNKKPKHLVRNSIVTLMALIVLLAILTGGGNKKVSTHSTSNTSATNMQSSQPATKQQPSTAEQIANWDTKYGANLSDISADLGAASKDASNQDQSALLADCQKLQTDVATAQAEPGIPDNSTEQHWSGALSYFQSGSQDCINGLNDQDANEVTQAANEFTQGNNELTAANATLKQIASQ